MSKKKETIQNEDDPTGKQSNACEEEKTANELIVELTTLLDFTYAGRSCDQENLTRLVTLLANFNNATALRHKADAFALIFDRLLRTVKRVDNNNNTSSSSDTATEALVDYRFVQGLQILGASVLPFDQCSSHMSSLLDTCPSQHYRQPWFARLFSVLAKRLDKSKKRDIIEFVRDSFKRLLTVLNNDNDDHVHDDNSLIDTLCNTVATLPLFDVPASCDDQLVQLTDSLLALVEPLLPNHLSSGCWAVAGNRPAVAAWSPDDSTSIGRAACGLLGLLLKQIDSNQKQPRRHRIFSLVLNATVHFEKIIDSPSASSSAAATANAACDGLLSAFGYYCTNSNLATVNDDFDALFPHLFATCCFRALTSKCSLLAVYMFSQSLLSVRNRRTARENAFVAKMAECARLSALRRSDGWLAAASGQCSCACRHSQSFKKNFDTPLSHVFAALTCARLRRMLDTIDPDDHLFLHEEGVHRLAVRLLETGDVELAALASQLFDYALATHRGSNFESCSQLLELIMDLVQRYFTLDFSATTATSMSTRHALCKELTRLLHSGAASPSASPSDCSGQLTLPATYVVLALYDNQSPYFDYIDSECDVRIDFFGRIVAHVLKVLGGSSGSSNSDRCLDKLE